ncbi:MAG: HAD family hydrolase [Candidatus Paceibacterota bacterium]|jgi:phosphoglycolate phosphatase-like HAD superfamily hydrolase
MDLFEYFDKPFLSERKWISVQSELEGLDGKKDIKIELMEDGKPRAIAFFDIDGTLAHLSALHDKAIAKLFPDQEPVELEETYYKGFKLGNSFREFDRMRGIYIDGHTEWKDPEIYLKERFMPHAEEIDQPEHSAHNIAAAILKEYGEVAALLCDEMYQKNPEEFEKSNIAPIFKLAQIYARLGIPMVGFTANAKVLVDKLAKYLKLSDIFLDIATDETMVGGGKEIAIHTLIKKLELKGIPMPEGRMIFVGDSLRGDIGTSLTARNKDKGIFGQGILVLQDQNALIEAEKEINNDVNLRHIADNLDVYGFVTDDVPIDENGNPVLLARFRNQFIKKL